MAVLSDVPGLKVEVFVNDNALHEYDDNGETKPKTVTKYVEAVSGANFEIRYVFAPPFDAKYGVCVTVVLDGKVTSTRVLSNSRLRAKEVRRIMGANWRKDGQEYCAKFSFSELQIARDGENLSNPQTKHRLASVGLVSAKFHFVKDLELVHEPADYDCGLTTDLGLISKKATVVEGLSHFASLDTPKRTSRERYNCTLVDGEDHPFAVFNFKYRSLAALKALHIVPRTPSPVPLEQRPEEELTPAQSLELIRRLKARAAATTSNVKKEVQVKKELKREHVDDDDLTLVSASPVKRSRDERKPMPNNKDVIVID